MEGYLTLQGRKDPDPWGTPMHGFICMTCETLDATVLLNGDFMTTICQ